MVGNAVIKQRPVKTGESVISTSPTPMSRSLDLNQNKNILGTDKSRFKKLRFKKESRFKKDCCNIQNFSS